MPFGDGFKTFPILQTPRLVLTELVAEDAAEYHRQQRSALDLPDRPPWSFGLRQHARRDTDRWGDTMLMAVLKGELPV